MAEVAASSRSSPSFDPNLYASRKNKQGDLVENIPAKREKGNPEI